MNRFLTSGCLICCWEMCDEHCDEYYGYRNFMDKFKDRGTFVK